MFEKWLTRNGKSAIIVAFATVANATVVSATVLGGKGGCYGKDYEKPE